MVMKAMYMMKYCAMLVISCSVARIITSLDNIFFNIDLKIYTCWGTLLILSRFFFKSSYNGHFLVII